ncbi:MAG: hypothetical protein KDD36_02005 [Flavobacteriales bacterium]|nr:hypothetical protein [Flavobacteriales bacterium]
MKKYLVTYHAPVSAQEQMQNNSPEDAQKGMEAWMNWAKKCGEHMVDLGTPLMGGQKLDTNGGSTASKNEVCGYSILQAESMEHAKQLLQGHPHLGYDNTCQIEVHEALPIPGM